MLARLPSITGRYRRRPVSRPGSGVPAHRDRRAKKRLRRSTPLWTVGLQRIFRGRVRVHALGAGRRSR